MSSEAPLKPACLVVISAPSGCGKTTVVDRLLKRHPEWVRSISATTRKPRVGEKEGSDYFFMTADAFKEQEASGELLESATVFDRQYGTPQAFVLKSVQSGKNVVLAIDVQGMQKIQKVLPADIPAVTIFILPPSMKVLRERLEGRKTDSPEEIERRISMAQGEIKAASLYDFTVMNQTLEDTVLKIEKFIDDFQKERRKK